MQHLIRLNRFRLLVSTHSFFLSRVKLGLWGKKNKSTFCYSDTLVSASTSFPIQRLRTKLLFEPGFFCLHEKLNGRTKRWRKSTLCSCTKCVCVILIINNAKGFTLIASSLQYLTMLHRCSMHVKAKRKAFMCSVAAGVSRALLFGSSPGDQMNSYVSQTVFKTLQY